jgi:hypothetical protein
MKIISRSEAIKKNLNKYFTGNHCCRGHLAERYVSNSMCCICKCEHSKNWLKTRKGRKWRKTADKFNKLKCKYGISKEEWEEASKRPCEICNRDYDFSIKKGGKSMVVDHCHKSGKTRGFLCSNCNKGIGMLQDDTVVLQQAINYLEEWINEDTE